MKKEKFKINIWKLVNIESEDPGNITIIIVGMILLFALLLKYL